MGRQCKISQLGLDETAHRLITEGYNTRSKLLEKLRQDYGADLSPATVGRFLAKARSNAHTKAHQIISDHVERTVPNDLDAIEKMERICLEWAQETPIDQARRIAAAVGEIKGEYEKWRELLIESDDPDQAVSWIIRKCLLYIQRDARLQKQRLAAMKQAESLINTKLSRAGLIDDDEKGRILIMRSIDPSVRPVDADNDDSGRQEPVETVRKPFVIHSGGGDD